MAKVDKDRSHKYKGKKFYMYFGDKRIRTLDDLQGNFSADFVLEKYHNGELSCWLIAWNQKEKWKQVLAIHSTTARAVLSDLCRIFAPKNMSEDIDDIDIDISVEKHLANLKYREGLNYYYGNGDKPDYKKAMDCFLKAAEQWHAGAQYVLGLIYFNGQCGEQDYAKEKAFKWFFRAGKQGHTDAINMMVSMSKNEQYWEQNYKNMLKKWLKLAKQGFLFAQKYVGCRYFFGYGWPKNDKKAFEWFLKAARQGDADAEHMLGWMCYNGHIKKNIIQYTLTFWDYNKYGVPNNIQEAVYWFFCARMRGSKKANEMLERLGKEGYKDIIEMIDFSYHDYINNVITTNKKVEI